MTSLLRATLRSFEKLLTRYRTKSLREFRGWLRPVAGAKAEGDGVGDVSLLDFKSCTAWLVQT
jgi:hypothetical protein